MLGEYFWSPEQWLGTFLEMAAMPFPLWRSFDIEDFSLAKVEGETLSSKTLIYNTVIFLSFYIRC